MTGSLEAEPREGILTYTTLSLVPDALSCPSLLREPTQIHEGGPDEVVTIEVYPHSCRKAAEEVLLDVCRVCQCSEADKAGEVALKVLGISVPSHAINQNVNASTLHAASVGSFVENEKLSGANAATSQINTLIRLGCSCKNELALAHYACALRWFVSRGSLTCEICGTPALNLSILDRITVLCALKGKGSSQHQSHDLLAMGCVETNSTCIVSSIGSEELVQVTAWFAPIHDTTNLSWSFSEQVSDAPDDSLTPTSPAIKWAVEAAGILIATGLLTVTITWLLSPRVEKGVARRGLNVLLGGLCALSIVVFLRFGVLPRIKYGPARYWAILVLFWFLVFGVWASMTRSLRSHM